MTSKPLIFWLAMMLLAGGALVIWYGLKLAQKPPVASGQDEEVDYGEPVDHFQLTQSTGERFDSHSLDGKIWIASFFWSQCPHECRDMNEAKKKLVAEFGHRGVQFVSITCDAETDTPARLAEEAQRFHADPDTWHFLTGNQQYIEKVGANIFKVHVEPKSHSPHLIVVDRAGEKRGYFNFKNPVEMENLRALVNELLAANDEDEAPENATPATVITPTALDNSAMLSP